MNSTNSDIMISDEEIQDMQPQPCRYCFENIDWSQNYSVCGCKGKMLFLCKTCLTIDVNNQISKSRRHPCCSVCLTPYKIINRNDSQVGYFSCLFQYVFNQNLRESMNELIPNMLWYVGHYSKMT
jgi:hypothetical protein